MFMSAMTLIRLTSGVAIETGSDSTSCNAPSVRTAHADTFLLRLDVHVGGTVAHGLLEDEIDHFDDGCVGVDLDLGTALARQTAALLGSLPKLLQRSADLGLIEVRTVDRIGDVGRRRDEESDRSVQELDQSRLKLMIERVGDRDLDSAADLAQRQRGEGARLVLGEQTDDGDVGAGARDVHGVQSGLLGERGAEDSFRDDTEFDEDLTQPLAARGLRAERVAQLLAGKIAALDEERAERRELGVDRRLDDAEIIHRLVADHFQLAVHDVTGWSRDRWHPECPLAARDEAVTAPQRSLSGRRRRARLPVSGRA